MDERIQKHHLCFSAEFDFLVEVQDEFTLENFETDINDIIGNLDDGWWIESDSERVKKADEGHRVRSYVGMKLCSPVYENTRSSYSVCEKVIAELGDFDVVTFNHTCGFRVRVSQPDGRGFRLIELQKLFTILWCGGERAINMIHPQYRVPTSPDYVELRLYSDLAHQREFPQDPAEGMEHVYTEEWKQYLNAVRSHRSLSPDQRAQMRILWQAQDLEELDALTRTPLGAHKCSYSFSTESGIAHAFEFLQAKMIISENGDVPVRGYYRAWLDFVTGLVWWAAAGDARDMKRLLGFALETEDLLRVLLAAASNRSDRTWNYLLRRKDILASINHTMQQFGELRGSISHLHPSEYH